MLLWHFMLARLSKEKHSYIQHIEMQSKLSKEKHSYIQHIEMQSKYA